MPELTSEKLSRHLLAAEVQWAAAVLRCSVSHASIWESVSEGSGAGTALDGATIRAKRCRYSHRAGGQTGFLFASSGRRRTTGKTPLTGDGWPTRPLSQSLRR